MLVKKLILQKLFTLSIITLYVTTAKYNYILFSWTVKNIEFEIEFKT